MSLHDHDPRPVREFTERDLLIATLVGRYVERRERGDAPCAHDLLAVASEQGTDVVADLRDVLAFYEAMRATDGGT
jgi:hypothetical protein